MTRAGPHGEPAGSGIHHVGNWSDDVAADSAELVRRSFVTEASRTGSDGAPAQARHRCPATGIGVEPEQGSAGPLPGRAFPGAPTLGG
jgi:hypothetical protein